MKKFVISIIIILFSLNIWAQNITADEILQKVDANRISKSQITTIKMIVHGRRADRTMIMKSYSKGSKNSFTEYLSPAREKGTKMLKLDDNLWIYSPGTDRIIRISGHMLRQSVMGSDMSYEDLMSDTEMRENYTAKILGEEKYNERNCWQLELLGNTPDLAYAKRIIWIDKERFIGLKEELYGMSGTLLKKTEISEVFKIADRWYPKHLTFKDVLKSGGGTEIIFQKVEFDVTIPKGILTKAALRK